MHLSKSQMQTTAVIPMISGTLSVAASITVICMILRSHIKLKTTYHRIMFGLCSSEVFLSLSLAMSTFPVPRGTTDIAFALGNQITCDIQGFIHVLGCISFNFYLCGLTGYFLLAITIEASDEVIAKYYEPVVHCISIGYSVFAATFTAIHSGFFTSDNICWIAPKPLKCNKQDDVDCVSGSDFLTLRWAFLAAPIMISFCVVTTNMFIIFWSLLHQKDNTGISVGQSPRDASSTYSAVVAGDEELSLSVELDFPTTPQSTPNFEQERKPSFVALYEESKKKSKKLSKTARLRKDGMHQALLYIAMFTTCNLVAFMHHFFEGLGMRGAFVLLVIQKVIYPLQGFFIFCIFIRPRVMQSLRSPSDVSFMKAVISAIQSRGEAQTATRRRVRTPPNNGSGRRQRRFSETFNAIISPEST